MPLPPACGRPATGERKQAAGGAPMHPYRTHTCGELRLDNASQPARLSGWIHRKRD
ncbi:MAG TPA: hypothetical protein HPP75_06380, partial [Rhodospirillaceae bacterium]|nr:hypothetical protein [Rhodospirillaceae bacterium]